MYLYFLEIFFQNWRCWKNFHIKWLHDSWNPIQLFSYNFMKQPYSSLGNLNILSFSSSFLSFFHSLMITKTLHYNSTISFASAIGEFLCIGNQRIPSHQRLMISFHQRLVILFASMINDFLHIKEFLRIIKFLPL
jgi:hypothetical protein